MSGSPRCGNGSILISRCVAELSDRGKTAEKVTKCAVSGLLLRKGSAAARFLRQGVAGFAR